jgi:hypothetical protein
MEITGKDGYRHILASSVVFESLPPAALEHITTRGLLVEMEPGESVLTEGTRGPGLYVVLEGLVEPARACGGLPRCTSTPWGPAGASGSIP